MLENKYCENRLWSNSLRIVLDNANARRYGYDANGESVYKLTGQCALSYQNNKEVSISSEFADAVLYPNPYMVITPRLYTKHYYANGERLAAIVGRGGFYNMSPDAITTNITEHENFLYRDWSQRYQTDYPFNYCRDEYNVTENIDIDSSSYYEIQYHCGPHPIRRLYINLSSDILLNTIYSNLYVNNIEDEVYYTHNNHLGSAAWITERHGGPVQYLHYLPYGQLLANQMATGYDERFKFIGKERDWESGYDYFGARYYASPFMHFASVEPLLDNYLHISPYCNYKK